MAFNLKMSLLCAVCILISGLLGSFKSFQIYEEQRQTTIASENHEVSQWVAQTVEQKLQQLEASVSYLDKSTVETLKRFGTRYFAYAFKQDGEWSIKWKILSEMGKEAILSEVGELSFDGMTSDKRRWVRSKSHDLIYIAPVEIAESHQLKSGFLIFGLSKKFFGFLSSRDNNISLLGEGAVALHGDVASSLVADGFLEPKEEGEQEHRLEDLKGETNVLTRYFSSFAQMWVVKATPMAAGSYFASSFFTYFLMASALSLMIFSMLMTIYLKRSIQPLMARREAEASTDDVVAETETAVVTPASPELVEMGDLSSWLQNLLGEETDRLRKLDIRLKTQFEEEAKVMAAPSKLRDFIKRLIGNSVLALDGEDEKEIQLQLVEEKDSYQFIYVDSRSKMFPTGQESSVFLQSDGSMEGIDGIISYASWLFGEELTVAKKGFCLSINFAKVEAFEASGVEAAIINPSLDRIEIKDEDTDVDLFGELSLNQQQLAESGEIAADLDEDTNVSFDEVVEQFKMKSFEFNSLQEANEEIEAIDLDTDGDSEPVDETDDKGFVELNSGQFKLKIRSPKKRDMDANS